MVRSVTGLVGQFAAGTRAFAYARISAQPRAAGRAVQSTQPCATRHNPSLQQAPAIALRRLAGPSRSSGRPVRFYLRRREQLLYLVVGGWNTLFGYAIWAVLQYLLGDHLHYLVIVLISWPIAVLNAYLGYRYVVFRSRGPIRRELPRFSTGVRRSPWSSTSSCCRSRCRAPVQHLRHPGAVHGRSSSSAAIWLTSTTASVAASTGTPTASARTIPQPHRESDRCPTAEGTRSAAADRSSRPATTRKRTSARSTSRSRPRWRPSPGCDYDHLFIDNASTDRTVAVLRELAAAGQARQGHRQHAQLRPHPLAISCVPAGARRCGDRGGRRPAGPAGADPRVPRRSGRKATRSSSASSTGSQRRLADVRRIRRFYYWLVAKHVVRRRARAQLHRLRPVRPGGRRAVPGHGRAVSRTSAAWSATSATSAQRSTTSSQPRVRGKTKNNFFTLYDLAMLGITNHSKVPLRLATMAGFAISILSLLVAFGYLVLSSCFGTRSISGWRRCSLASTSLARCSCSSSGCSASTSARSTRRSISGRWSWSGSGSTSTIRRRLPADAGLPSCRPNARMTRVRR